MSDEGETPQRQERLQEILLSYVEATEAGAAPEQHAFLAAHPEFAEELAEFLASYTRLNHLVTPLRHGEPHRTGLASAAKGPELPTEASAPATVSAKEELGQLGDYRLLREIGRGGMGVVYEAEQISLRRRVALKILPFAGAVDARQLQRFRNEAEAAAHLHHSHIVPVFAVGAERGVHFYAMQHIEGQSLAALIADLVGEAGKVAAHDDGDVKVQSGHRSTQTVGALTTQHSTRSKRFFQTVATIGKHVAEALEYAHQMGVVHRDIKPANLLLDARGEVWITDFGLAQFQSQVGLTMSGEVLGTLRYASPEQAMARRGLVDHRTDIYSLGATLYELLTLRPVFDGKDRHALLQQIGFAEPVPPRRMDSAIPVELETIILKALAKNPAERYGSAQELADDLERFLHDQPVLARRPSLAERVRKWSRRHPAFVGAAVLLLVFGLIGFALTTVLIAREQWKTQVAYNQLSIEERHTREAFAQLATEEKRTRAAYAELAAEQARTRAAYEAEARQRDLAERDFAQARRAVELVVQFSEGELAHHPGQQDVRRRLLLTVLDYYEEFLADHADDPDIQAELTASREQVALILSELSSLRGTTLVAIVQDAAVQKDLQFNPDQSKRITQLASKLARPVNPREKGPRASESAAVVEKALGDILNPAQKQRLQQIVLQVQQQGRHGFSDPRLVEALHLTNQQREQIRKIQNETHQKWADHLFTDRKIKKPGTFWREVQERIVQVFTAEQRAQWEQMMGVPIAVDLREGYPWDGKNVTVPRPGPCFGFPCPPPGPIAVLHASGDFTGSGFGHKIRVDDRQYYSWRGQEIPPTIFEIAVTTRPLSPEERPHLVVKESPGSPGKSGGPSDWQVLFRSDDPSIWNTDSPDEQRFAIPVTRAHRKIRYLRLQRLDTGEMQIIPIRYTDLASAPKTLPERGFVWNGSANLAFGGRHLGIAEIRSQPPGPFRGWPRRGEKK